MLLTALESRDSFIPSKSFIASARPRGLRRFSWVNTLYPLNGAFRFSFLFPFFIFLLPRFRFTRPLQRTALKAHQ
jgi:hypothetical protein